MNTLTIILIVLTIVLLISNIVMFKTERAEKHELNFDKTKAKIILFASDDAHELARELVKSEAGMIKKYDVIDSAIDSLKTKHGVIYISGYLVERK